MSSPNILALTAKNGGRRSGYSISEVKRAQGFRDLEKKIAELKLDTKSDKVQIVGRSQDGSTIGTDGAKQVSIKRYEYVWKGLLDFCFFINDLESAMILTRAPCPADPLPVSVDTVIHYLRFLVLKKGTALMHHKTDEPILDANGNAILCRGDWQS